MLSSCAAGARFVLLNAAVVQPAVSLAEAGLASAWRIGPQQLDHGHDSYVEITLNGTLKALRPLAPVRLTGRSDAGGVTLSWIRQTRTGGDSWDLAEVPLGEDSELYRITILDGATVKRAVDVSTPQWIYSTANMAADFGGLPSSFTTRVAQVSAGFGAGTALERIINV